MIIPARRYRNPEAALAFLAGVLGLDEHAVYRDEYGALVHAELRIGDGVVMIGPWGRGAFDDHMIDPKDTGGRETTTIYAVIPDVADRYERAKDAGAEIVLPYDAHDHGGHSFSVADPEGHMWTFGDYDPLAGR
ncbi:Glyoxalase family protein [Rhodovulum sp. P5]|uniref:VOC family protein n=1 Tax=Rhodovulum sp. P5 TaxID=1564506 RepID=UPI0009C38D37|nr:VOC family protein [Rhodovulum sp. P5]ARE39648.1 Glyoxalase family protein [Rhodovulum sp. P5]